MVIALESSTLEVVAVVGVDVFAVTVVSNSKVTICEGLFDETEEMEAATTGAIKVGAVVKATTLEG